MKLARFTSVFSLCLTVVGALALGGCKVPERLLQAEGRLTVQDCLAEGASPETLPASALVATGVKLGFGEKTVIRVKPTSEGPLTREDVDSAARSTRAYRYATESNDKVEGKMIETVTVTEKFKQAKGQERCQAARVQAVEMRTECPADLTSEQPCSSKLEISTFSATDPVEAREPLSVFATKRVKHARGQNPFTAAALPVAGSQ